MNIFYLDTNARKCAEYHCDKHVVKMCIEYAQLLSIAIIYRSVELSATLPLYSTKGWSNHPCSIWTRYSESTFLYLVDLATELGNEYTKRYKKVHKSIATVVNNLELPDFDRTDWIDPPLCMPEQYRGTNAVDSYRQYYIKEKSYFAKWQYSKIPEWYNDC